MSEKVYAVRFPDEWCIAEKSSARAYRLKPEDAEVWSQPETTALLGFFGQELQAIPLTPNPTVAQAAKVLLEAKNRDGSSVLPNYVLDQLKILAGGEGHE